MRILLDECVPAAFARELSGHDVRTVQRMRWSGIRNGTLLALAASEFEVFLTIDSSIRHQQVVPSSLALITLRARENTIETLRQLAPAVLDALSTLRPGTSLIIG